MNARSRPTPGALPGRASPFELLFDLVFVFTITQVTHVVIEEPDFLGAYKAVILLALVYCVYDGYMWLMNQGATSSAVTRAVLLIAMAGFLVIAVAIPRAFGAGQWVFTITFLVLMVLHHALFLIVGSAGNVRGILRIGPFNIVAAIVLVASGLLGESGALWLFPLALVIILANVLTNRRGGFELGAAHLIERHGLLMLIAFGEAIVAVGATLSRQPLDAFSLGAATLTVAVVGGLWSTYFPSGDLARTEHGVEDRDARSRTMLAITAFYGDHLGMMVGLVLFAAGSGLSIQRSGETPLGAGLLAAVGIAIYLASQALYRVELGLGRVAPRLVGTAAAAAVAVASFGLGPLVELALLLVVVATVASWGPLAHATQRHRAQAAHGGSESAGP
ncbi:low temperature requirement protein A [Microbacterium sp. zg.B48]|uniref:low temperature requirement protein A n=1 Tax=Microbacterium sp. zg.B48 TaxID=2969408 RepID=UPI00214B14A1|nr:low temperature requirement protein A [Microbacterium sp. zg.B48]MCR2763359.1 low temperature requirement protein A [Microbacterium sp. zg.B48]